MIPFLVFVVPLATSAWFLHKRSRHRGKHPLWPALGATAGAALLMVAGAVGYNLDALDANAAGTPWSGAVIWWEVGAGIALLPVAAYCWHKGLSTTGKVCGVFGAGITASTAHAFWSVTVSRKRSAATVTTRDAGDNCLSLVK